MKAQAIILGIWALSGVPAVARGFSGDYSLSFYRGTHREFVGTVCAQLTENDSYPYFRISGTWTFTDLPGWSGEYVLDHHKLRLFATGSFGGQTQAMAIHVEGTTDGSRGGWDHYFPTIPPQPLEGGLIIMNVGCTGAPTRHFLHFR